MKNAADDFFATLHKLHLKPRGYTKIRHTFSRKMEFYTERIQFQGSSWNSANLPWVFYINFGVEFHDLPPRTPDRDFPSTHCWTRIPDLVAGAPAQASLPLDVPASFVTDVAKIVEQGSAYVRNVIHQVRSNYLSHSWPTFPTVSLAEQN